MPDVVGKKFFLKIIGILVIFQICEAIIIPVQEQPRPAYTSGIKTSFRRSDSPYTLQNYSRVVVHNRPDIAGAQYVITKTDEVKSVYPVFNPNTNRQRPQNYQNILQTQSHTQIDAGEASRTNRTIIKRKIEAKTLDIYTKCPSGATGQFIYSASCNQFLNCWKGRGTVQNCAPGTLFNPKSLECDFPDKVECVTGPRSNTVENIRVQKSIQQATCPEGFSGIIPDYFDCSKFINCNNGQENKMDCAPGTLFDINKNMCDYPDQTTCFNGENTLNAKTTQLNCNSVTHCDLNSNSLNYGQSEYDQTGSDSNQRPVYNQGQYQFSTSTYGESGGRGGNSYSQSHTVKKGCNPATQNCGQFSGQRPTYNQGQNQYPSSTNGQSGTDLSGGNSYSQSHTVTQGCNPTTQNCGQFSGQRPTYNQGQNQYPSSTNGQSGTDLSGGISYSQSHTVTQGCNPTTQNCGEFSGQRPTYNQGQNHYPSSTNGQSGTDLSGGNSYSQSHTVTQGCNPTTQNCGQFSGQRPTYNQGQKQYSTSNYGQSQTNYQTGQNGVFNCDLSKPNCGHDEQPNYGKVCNVNDQNCGQNQWVTQKPITKRPAVNSQPICPNDSVGLHKHPTDCKKYLSCGSGQTFVMDCAAGTLFNEKTGMCDFSSNVQCVVSEVVEDKGTGGGNYDESWQRQYENNKQKFGQNAGHGNIRYTTEEAEVYNQLPSENSQQTITDNNRGNTGYVKRPNVKNTPLDYEDVYNPDNNIVTGTTPRSAWPPPYQTTDTNELGETDYVFTYDNGDPVVLEPDNVIEVKERVTTKSCDDESFHCSPKYCVPLTTICDGVRDCSDSKDELNCQEYTDRFITKKNFKLVVPENQRYINITHSTCAVLCIQNKKFTCRSFTYRSPDRTCFLSDKNIGMSGALQAYQSSDYYELKAGSIDCSDTSKYFECENKKCLTKDHLCDGYTDCENREDEKHCGPEKFGYKIKLVGSNEKNAGRVEVTVFNSTGYICDDDFSIVDANVICRELGFALGAAEIKGQSQFAKDLKESNTLYMIDDLNCIGNESSLIDCSFPGWGIHNCRDQEIAGIVCKTPQEKCGDDAWKCDSGNECIPFDFVCDGVDDCADESDEAVQHCESPTDLRLVGGSYPGEGRLEIKHNGIWGTVCDDDFNEDAAKVVCKFLGYKGHSVVKKDGYFGAGYGPIWLDQVSCFGNETELNKCTHWNWGEHNCEHSEDVGVICSQDAEEVKIERHSNLPARIEEGLPRNCGFRKDNQFAINDLIQARVIGGGVAQKGDYPWQAALKVRVKEKSAHWCGAIIISSRWVLTAAHCLQGYTKGAYIIVAGEYDTNENEGTEQQKYIDEFFIHEMFRKGHKLNNDIALIKVKGSGFELNDDVQPICLADADTDYNRKLNCTISGFGSIKSGSSSVSHNLLAAWIPIHSQDICKMEHVYGNILTDGMICAGSMDGGLDACDGDSGGPLACLDQGVFTLYGITSWGQHCGYANKPGVYVKVGHYKKWIENIIAKHSN